jgi:hypothetical protein
MKRGSPGRQFDRGEEERGTSAAGGGDILVEFASADATCSFGVADADGLVVTAALRPNTRTGLVGVNTMGAMSKEGEQTERDRARHRRCSKAF